MPRCRPLVGLLVFAGLAAYAAGDFKHGDWAMVNKDGAEIKLGSEVMATVNKGQRLKLYWVFKEGGYALIYYKMGGKTCPGYIRLADLDPAPGAQEKEKALPKNPFAVDDKVVVIAKEAKLKAGDQVVATLPEGTPLVVQKVKDEWLGVTTTVNGKPTQAWIHSRDVDYPTLKDKEKLPPAKEPKKDGEDKK
ncbi:MAG: hypothetical protein FJ290_07155 [Planctomycetes bacterium]|nr:hypothetical protein [Planctomycetota bacterium]